MNYYKIVQGILDIGEGMLRSGAENFRLGGQLLSYVQKLWGL